jgi:hypothetical protein
MPLVTLPIIARARRHAWFGLIMGVLAVSAAGCRTAQAAALAPAPCADSSRMQVVLERRVQYLLTSTDSVATGFRAQLQLSPASASEIGPVRDASICSALLAAYDRERKVLEPPYVASTNSGRRIVAARGGSYYFVYDPDPALQYGEFYLLMVFNADLSQLLGHFTH